MNKCASLCLREIETARGTVMPVVYSLKCWVLGHVWDQSISGFLSSPPTRLQKWMRQQGGEGSGVLFTNKRKAEEEHKAMLTFQSLCSSLLLRRRCVTCSHHLSFPLQRGFWQKRPVPGLYSGVFACLLHLIGRERQCLASSYCSCLLNSICFLQPLHSCPAPRFRWKSPKAGLSQTASFGCTVNSWTLHPFLRFPSFPLLAIVMIISLWAFCLLVVSTQPGFWNDQ